MNSTRSGEQVSAQIGKMGVIGNLADKNFSLDTGNGFNIKNDDVLPVELTVRLKGMTDFITTTFMSGWNPEIIAEIQQTNKSNLNLKWGF